MPAQLDVYDGVPVTSPHLPSNPAPNGGSVLERHDWNRVGLWGPRVERSSKVHTRQPHQPAADPPRWGLGDVWWGLSVALILSSLLMVGWATASTLPTVLAAPDTIDPQALASDVEAQAATLTGSAGFALASLVALWVGLAGAPLRASYSKGLRSFARDFGWTFRRRDAAFGCVAAAVLRGCETLIVAGVVALGVDPSEVGNANYIKTASGWVLVALLMGAGIVGPVVEELFFRGLTLGAFLRRFSRLPSRRARLAGAFPVAAVLVALCGVQLAFGLSAAGIVGVALLAVSVACMVLLRGPKRAVAGSVIMSSIIFGVAHAQIGASGFGGGSVVVICVTGMFGAVLAVMRLRTGRSGLNVFTHCWFNVSGLALILLTG